MGLLKNYKKSEVLIKKEKYESKFNYSEFNEEDRQDLIDLEKKVLHTGNLLKENLKELGDVFLQAHKIFSNNKNGTFGKWYEALGFKKDFVYLCLDRKQLSIQYKDKDIYKLPDRLIKDIKKLEKQNEEIVIEILESENPKEKVKEIKKNMGLNNIKEDKSLKQNKLTKKLINLFKILENNNFDSEKLLRIDKILKNLEEEIA